MGCRRVEAFVEEGIRAGILLRAVREEGEVEEGVDTSLVVVILELYSMVKLIANRKLARLVGGTVEEMEGVETD